jgi:hypothetical protein
VLTQVAAGEVPPTDQLERAVKHLERVRRWDPSAELNSELGFLRLLQAFQMDEADPNRIVLAGLAAADLRESLRLSPARPHPWVRLAYARAIEGANASEIVRLLDQSIQAGPFVGEVAIVRLKRLLVDWDQLPPDLRLYAFRQIRWIWNSDQKYLLRAARQTSRPEIMRFALRPIPGAVARFDRALVSY